MATSLVMDFSESANHLDYLFSGVRGYVIIGLLDRRKPKTPPVEKAFRWPGEREELIQYVQDVHNREVFVCPYPMESRQRGIGNTTTLRMLHTDMDFNVPGHLRRDLKKWGFRLVASGTPGHVQAFARLSRAVTPDEHRGLEVALRDWGSKYGKTEKIADNDFMRVPGKVSMKNGNMVTILSHGRSKVDVDKFIAALNIDLNNVRVPGELPDVNPVRIPHPLEEDVEALLSESSREGTRSERAYSAVLTVVECGYNRDEIHAILADYAPGVDKYGVRWPAQIDAVLAKSGVGDVELFDPDENFWNRRKALRHIKEYAYATDANPWATLGVTMVNVLHQIPPRVMMPGRNGTEVGIRALNMYVALVGRSGAGKKTATDAAKHAIDVGEMYPLMNLGSGEGISKAFRRQVMKGDDGKKVIIKNDQVIKTTKVIFDVGEISSWNGLASRQGATLTPELLKGFSGEALGFSNSDDLKTNYVPADEYRMGLVIGAQPLKCGPLLANADSGLPQRFLWMPAKESREHDFDDRPTVPSALVWEPPEFDSSGPFHTIHFPRPVLRKLFYYGRKCQDSKDPLDAHAPVIKARVCIALALLDGRPGVNDEDWELAGMVMLKSERTRDAVMKILAKDRRGGAKRRGAQRGIERAEEERVVDLEKTKMAKEAIVRYLERNDGWVTGVARKLNSRHSAVAVNALSELVAEKQIKVKRVNVRGQQVSQHRLA
jgi:hypothetical protein